jgi:HEAT repeat protein
VTSRLAFAILMVVAAASAAAAQDVRTSLSSLSALDRPMRMNAARALRRLPAAEVVPALIDAARSHEDQFVRSRALVLLTAFGDPWTPRLVQSLVSDRNDRVREVVYRWFEQQPDPRSVPGLLAALETEQAEFVRPALVRALAAHGDNAAVQRALIAGTTRGPDLSRSAVVEALGEHKATYAVDAITRVAAIEGPIQDDAVLALARIGARQSVPLIKELMLPADAVPARHAALCLLDDDCPAQITALSATLRNATAAPAVTRAAALALGAIAEEGHDPALAVLLSLAGQTRGRIHDEIAAAFASAAIRVPEATVTWIDASADRRAAAIELLRAGFELLEEDFAEEQFFATLRAAYWGAPESSQTRTITATIIDRLEF